MKKKTVNNMLKGAVITGTAVGGASVFGDMGLAYAGELNLEENEIIFQTTGEGREDGNEGGTGGEDYSGGDGGHEETNVVDQGDENGTGEGDTDNYVAPPTDEQLSEEAAASLSTEESTLSSTSVSNSESLSEQEDAYSESISYAEETLASESQQFVDQGYIDDVVENEKLDELEDIIDDQMDAEKEVREQAGSEGNYLNSGAGKGNYRENYYTNTCRPLALSMINYKLVIDGSISENATFVETMNLDLTGNSVSYKYYTENYLTNHFCIKYVGLDGTYHEEYYDYVTRNVETGESMIKPVDEKGKILYTTGPDDDPANVSGINILKKDPDFNTSGKAKKTYVINGVTYKSYQRIGFKVGDNGTVKGEDWYSMDKYLEDVRIRKDLGLLPDTIDSLNQEFSEVVSSAETSMAASEAVSEARVDSLSASAANSTSMSEAKSESLSTSASESSRIAAISSQNTTTEASYSSDSPAASAAVQNVVAATETTYTEEVVAAPIGNERVPLAVVEEGYVDEEDTFLEDNNIDVVTQIDDDDVAKAISPEQLRKWAGTALPIVGTVATLHARKQVKDSLKE